MPTDNEITPEHQIEIKNVEAITYVRAPLPPGGGAIIWGGVNGCGKSTAIKAVRAIAGEKVPLRVRDGQRRGEVSGLGVRLVVARNTRRHGELVVESFESGLSLGTLIDPGVENPLSADARRIKALVALSGAKPDIAIFKPLLSEVEFAQYVGQTAIESDDLVEMAGCVKRDIESHARRIEKEATKAKTEAAAHMTAVGDVDLCAAIDEDEVQENLRLAMDRKAKLIAQRDAADAAGDASVKAKEKLELAEKSYEGPTVSDAQSLHGNNVTILDAADQKLDHAKEVARVAAELVDKADSAFVLASKQCDATESAVKTAKAHAKSMATWREALEAEVPLAPDPDDISTATAALDNAKSAFNRIPIIAKAKHSQWLAEDAAGKYGLRKAEGERLREAASGCEQVLSMIVGKLGSDLRVEAGRLVLETDRGTTYFAELSDGERAREAIDIAVAVAPKRSIFAVEQRVWEGLDPINRAAIVDRLVAKGVYMASAMPSADETLVVETLPAKS